MEHVYSLGCGDDLSHRVSDRRALYGAGAETVINVWRSMLEKLDLECELSTDMKMCRRFFSGFQRYSKLQCTLQDNLKKAI